MKLFIFVIIECFFVTNLFLSSAFGLAPGNSFDKVSREALDMYAQNGDSAELEQVFPAIQRSNSYDIPSGYISLPQTIAYLTDINEELSGEAALKERLGFYNNIVLGENVSTVMNNATKSQDIDGLWTNINRNYIQYQGSGSKHAVSELVSNANDAIFRKNNQPTIGRYGMGAFQIMNELEGREDYVEYNTVKDSLRHILTLRKFGDKVYYSYKTEKAEGVSNGTKVTIHKGKGLSSQEQNDLKKYLEKKYAFSTRVPLFVNNKRIGEKFDYDFFPQVRTDFPNEKIEINIGDKEYSISDTGTGMDADIVFNNLLRPRKRPETKVEKAEFIPKIYWKDAPSKDNKSKISFIVSGVTIEEIKTEGFNVFSDISLELPPDTWLPDSRDKVRIAEREQDSLVSLINEICNSELELDLKIKLINTICLAVRKKLEQQGDNLDRIGLILEKYPDVFKFINELGKDKLIVPNRKGFVESLRLDNVIYLDDLLYHFNPMDSKGLDFELKEELGVNNWKVVSGDLGESLAFED
ncbi:hypothetical protein KKC59_03135, partial [bacterium]|nr:hypothetical protein [bacterium]